MCSVFGMYLVGRWKFIVSEVKTIYQRQLGNVVQRDKIQLQRRNMDKTGRPDVLAVVLLGEGRLPSVR